ARRPRRSRTPPANELCGAPVLANNAPTVPRSPGVGFWPMGADWAGRLRTLLEAPSPAVLTTYRRDGSALVSPVWFRWTETAFEVVVAEGDMKLRHLTRDPRCVLVVFETVPPFRGVEVRGVAELIEGDATAAREAIAGR